MHHVGLANSIRVDIIYHVCHTKRNGDVLAPDSPTPWENVTEKTIKNFLPELSLKLKTSHKISRF